VLAADGELGEAKHVVVHPQTKEVTELVVQGDGRDFVVPAASIRRSEGDRVLVDGNRAAFARPFDRGRYHAVDDEQADAESSRRAAHGGAPLLNAQDDSVTVGTRTGETRTAGAPMPARAGAPADYRLQLLEEHLRPSTVREHAGDVHVGKRVTEHAETVEVPVTEERVVIERTPVQAGAPADGEIREQTFTVPVMKERVEARKETVVKEEVSIQKQAVRHTEQVQDTVRSEELDVRDGAALVEERRSHGSGPSPLGRRG